MGKSLNEVRLIGNLGKEPELKYTQTGTAVANFSIATTEQWKNADGEKQEKTEWHNIVAWKKLAEICGEYLKKGAKVYVAGRLQYRSWDDKNTGEKKYMTEIVIDNMIMLSSQHAAPQQAQEPAAAAPGASTDDDLPF